MEQIIHLHLTKEEYVEYERDRTTAYLVARGLVVPKWVDSILDECDKKL